MTSSAMPSKITSANIIKSKSSISIPTITETSPPAAPSKASAPSSPQRKHLLQSSGEEEQSRADSPLLQPGKYYIGVNHVPSLARISTCNSSLTHVGGTRQESYRLVVTQVEENRRSH